MKLAKWPNFFYLEQWEGALKNQIDMQVDDEGWKNIYVFFFSFMKTSTAARLQQQGYVLMMSRSSVLETCDMRYSAFQIPWDIALLDEFSILYSYQSEGCALSGQTSNV